jgi:hypothetical protein
MPINQQPKPLTPVTPIDLSQMPQNRGTDMKFGHGDEEDEGGLTAEDMGLEEIPGQWQPDDLNFRPVTVKPKTVSKKETPAGSGGYTTGQSFTTDNQIQRQLNQERRDKRRALAPDDDAEDFDDEDQDSEFEDMARGEMAPEYTPSEDQAATTHHQSPSQQTKSKNAALQLVKKHIRRLILSCVSSCFCSVAPLLFLIFIIVMCVMRLINIITNPSSV